MDDEQARILLGGCQPSGSDSDRPEVRDAFARAKENPELAAWLARERRSDAAIARKLQALEPPAGLRSSLLAGVRASQRSASRRRWRLPLGLAAMLMVTAGVVWWMVPSRHLFSAGDPRSLAAWQEACVGIFASPLFLLDVRNEDYAPLEAHLVAQGAPVAGELPFSDAVVSALGCKILDWNGSAVSLACFNAASGEVVHLFVMARGVIDEAGLPSGPRRGQIGAFAVVTWVQDDHLLMVASRLDAAKLDAALALDPARFAGILGARPQPRA